VIANHIHDAISQVHRLQDLVLSRRMFQGYSGLARLLSGTCALLGAAVLSTPSIPSTPSAHLIGWSIVLGAAIIANYAALVYWVLFNAEIRRNPRLLKPAIDALPALLTGGVLSIALISRGQYDLLFGTWMALYGLAQVAYRQSLPPLIYIVGLGYVVVGLFCLVAPGVSFTNPLPMGLVFFIGEWIGGIALYRLNHPNKEASHACPHAL
jgi:hypothetical protein